MIISIEKSICLAIIDEAWKEHLREMDDLKQSVQNAAYEQKDPLLIYKLESFDLFKKLLREINIDISSFLNKGNLPGFTQNVVKEAKIPRKSDLTNLRESREDMSFASRTQEPQKPQPVKVEKKVGRNDPCPCGSGKKYKHCHGKE